MFNKKIHHCCLSTYCLSSFTFGETILQYFGTSWNEINDRIPELTEAGWTTLWLPPFKAGSQYSVGFDTFDRFDLGKKIKWEEYQLFMEQRANFYN